MHRALPAGPTRSWKPPAVGSGGIVQPQEPSPCDQRRLGTIFSSSQLEAQRPHKGTAAGSAGSGPGLQPARKPPPPPLGRARDGQRVPLRAAGGARQPRGRGRAGGAARAGPEGRGGRSEGRREGASRQQTKAGRCRRRGGAVTGRRRLRSRGSAAGRGLGWARASSAPPPPPRPGPAQRGGRPAARRAAGRGRRGAAAASSRRGARLGRCPPLTCSSVKRISLSAALDAIALGFEVRTWTLPPPPPGRGAREAGPGPGLRAHRGRGERSALRQGDAGGAAAAPLPLMGVAPGAGPRCGAMPPCAPPPCRGARPWQRSAAAAAAPAAAADVAPFGCHPVAKAALLCGTRST